MLILNIKGVAGTKELLANCVLARFWDIITTFLPQDRENFMERFGFQR